MRANYMTPKEILAWYESEDERPIYGYSYGSPWAWHGANGGWVKSGWIEEWKKSELHLSGDSFVVIWGWPGPDTNTYRFSDYGITWAFSEDELVETEMVQNQDGTWSMTVKK